MAPPASATPHADRGMIFGVIQSAAILLALATGAMQLQTSDFSAGGAIPTQFMATDCGGKNHVPTLHWSGAPAGTKSFALIFHDRDAPIAGGFYHWVVYDIPATTHQLGGSDKPSGTTRLGSTSRDEAAYYGPCPPPGPAHHYTFTLYALDVAAVSTAGTLTGAQLEKHISGHVLAQATLAATATTPP